MLTSMTNPAYRAADTKLLLNQTTESILQQIKTAFRRAKEDDVSLFYYSGHGTSDGSLCGDVRGTTLSVGELKDALDQIPGKKIVILDSCYSGHAIGKGEDAPLASRETLQAFNEAVIAAFGAEARGNMAEPSYYVMTACSRVQTSLEVTYISSGKAVGLFTSQLLNGSGVNPLTNTVIPDLYADGDGDRALTLHEAYAYAAEHTAQLAQQLGCVQDAQVHPAYSAQTLWGR